MDEGCISTPGQVELEVVHLENAHVLIFRISIWFDTNANGWVVLERRVTVDFIQLIIASVCPHLIILKASTGLLSTTKRQDTV